MVRSSPLVAAILALACSNPPDDADPGPLRGPDAAAVEPDAPDKREPDAGMNHDASHTDAITTDSAASDAATEWSPAACPTNGPDVGYEVGQRLPPLVVKSCDGKDFSLDELCGANGLWLFAAAGWCPLCKSVSEAQESFHDGYASQGLASVTVIVETAASEPPDADYCALWRSTYGHDDVFTLYDPTGAILALWPGGSSSLHAFVDRDRVIVEKLVHTSDYSEIQAHIEKLLNSP